MTITPLERRVEDLERRLKRLIQIGVVAAVDYLEKRIEVRVADRVSAPLRFTASRAGADRTWHPPEIDEQVLILAPGGDLTLAVVGDSLYSNDFNAPGDSADRPLMEFADGTVIEYDRQAHRLRATIGDSQINVDRDQATMKNGDASYTATDGTARMEAGGSFVEVTAAGVNLNDNFLVVP